MFESVSMHAHDTTFPNNQKSNILSAKLNYRFQIYVSAVGLVLSVGYLCDKSSVCNLHL